MTGTAAGLIIDHTSIVLQFILPIWAVLRMRLFGLIVGSVFVWILGLFDRSIIHMVDSSDDNFTFAMSQFIRLLFGLICCLIYSGLIYVVSLPFYKKPTTKPSGDEIALQATRAPNNWKYTLRHLHPVERILLAVIIGFHLFVLFW